MWGPPFSSLACFVTRSYRTTVHEISRIQTPRERFLTTPADDPDAAKAQPSAHATREARCGSWPDKVGFSHGTSTSLHSPGGLFAALRESSISSTPRCSALALSVRRGYPLEMGRRRGAATWRSGWPPDRLRVLVRCAGPIQPNTPPSPTSGCGRCRACWSSASALDGLASQSVCAVTDHVAAHPAGRFLAIAIR